MKCEMRILCFYLVGQSCCLLRNTCSFFFYLGYYQYSDLTCHSVLSVFCLIQHFISPQDLQLRLPKMTALMINQWIIPNVLMWKWIINNCCLLLHGTIVFAPSNLFCHNIQSGCENREQYRLSNGYSHLWFLVGMAFQMYKTVPSGNGQHTPTFHLHLVYRGLMALPETTN